MAADLENFKMKIAMFDNGKPAELLKIIKDFKTEIKRTGNRTVAEKIYHLRTLLHRESLQAFDEIGSQVTGTTKPHLKFIKAGLLAYFF